MKIYFSVDPEVDQGESTENLIKIMRSLQDAGHTIYRAPYVLSSDPDDYLKGELELNRDPTTTEQREVHMKWIDESDILIAEVSVPSEGRSMVIQRALDKPDMGLNRTPIILIKRKNFKRKFGRIVRGLIEGDKVEYHEYQDLEGLLENLPRLIQKSTL